MHNFVSVCRVHMCGMSAMSVSLYKMCMRVWCTVCVV